MASPDTAQHSAAANTSSGDTAFKHQPVALEVPVTVNGARTIDGSDKREPFSETTKTVLIFGNGAVIRLSSTVAPGQLLFLTNEKTKKEVVCQVVKSKNYRSVSGYVELEFTESVVGFWGMRFPADRLGAVPQPLAPAPVAASSSSLASGSPAIPRAVAPRVEAPTVNVSPSGVAPKPPAPLSPLPAGRKVALPISVAVPAARVNAIPEVPVTPAPVKPVASESAVFDAPRLSEAQASFLEPASTGTSVTNLLSLFEVKPDGPTVEPAPAAPASVDPEAEALKQHTARLQEQLSSMLFRGAPAKPATASVQISQARPVATQKELAENAAKVLKMPRPSDHVKQDSLPAKSMLEEEELRIPAWLEPLARNAVAPASTEELVESENAEGLAEEPDVEQPNMEEIAAEAVTIEEEHSVEELPLPVFDALPTDEEQRDEEQQAEESEPQSSNKGILFGAIAAALLLAAGGGWWYVQQQSAGVRAGAAAPSQGFQASVIDTPTPKANPPSPPQGNVLSKPEAPAQTIPMEIRLSTQPNAASKAPSVVPASEIIATPHSSQPVTNPPKGGARTTSAAASVPAAIAEPKKPVLGEVHLATPKINAHRNAQNTADTDAGIALTSEEQPDPNAEALNGGLVAGNNQPSAPTAPLPIGGDVKPAKLITSVSPMYPPMAKSQHISGNVLVDALIDPNGRVTTMKIVSGPTLLRQAAMDALKQWKYQPALLDGKPVAMHLTVTLQFRLP
ncbi:MAG TPA: TonB family protein [Candidatus Cybelea sp.]|nr:TonB family protein [Candidatus Cybelea sp.]